MNCVYILRCADQTLYCGWTNDMTRRLAAHNGGSSGAKYTRSRRPVTLVHCEAFATQSDAMRHEAALKTLSRAEKERVILENSPPSSELVAILDARCAPCGALPRNTAHRCGLRHCVAHLIAFQTMEGVPGVWLQQRAPNRPILPARYDWTATGHIRLGETPIEGALREAQEETGLRLTEHQLIPGGQRRQRYLRAPDFLDDECVHFFACFLEQTPVFLPTDEVSRMVWAPAKALSAALTQGTALPVRTAEGTPEQIPAEALALSLAEWNRARRLKPPMGSSAPA